MGEHLKIVRMERLLMPADRELLQAFARHPAGDNLSN
jgi:hypothetical protein